MAYNLDTRCEEAARAPQSLRTEQDTGKQLTGQPEEDKIESFKGLSDHQIQEAVLQEVARGGAQESGDGPFSYPEFRQGRPLNWPPVHKSPLASKGMANHPMRASIKDNSPSSTESSHFNSRPTQMAINGSRLDEDYMMHLPSPGLMSRSSMGGGQRYVGMMSHEQRPRSSYVNRSLYSEEEAMAGSAYARGGMGMSAEQKAMYMRMPGHSPSLQSEVRGQLPQPSSSPRMVPNSQMHSRPGEGSPQVMASQQPPSRDGRMAASPMAGNLQRSASEGLMRGRGVPTTPHQRTHSGGGGPEDRLASRIPGPDQPPNLIYPRNIDTPDFAMIYAFLGSMFDPVCHMINHADVMQQMNPVDRETATLILANCTHNFGDPIFLNDLHNQLQPFAQPPRGGYQRSMRPQPDAQ